MRAGNAMMITIAFAGVGAIFGLLLFERIDSEQLFSDQSFFQVQNANFATQSVGGEILCNDQLDNDGDGFVDCRDDDCTANPQCESCIYTTKRDADTIRIAQGEGKSLCYCGDNIIQREHGEQCEQDDQCQDGQSCQKCGCISKDANQSPIGIMIQANTKPLRQDDTIVYKATITNKTTLPQSAIRIQATVPDYLDFTNSTPTPTYQEQNQLERTIDKLDPLGLFTMDIVMKNNAQGLSFGDTIRFCLTLSDQETQSCWRIPYVE